MATHDSAAMQAATRKYGDIIETITTSVKQLTEQTASSMSENDAPAVVKLGDEFTTSVMKALEIPKDILRQMEETTAMTTKMDEAMGGAK